MKGIAYVFATEYLGENAKMVKKIGEKLILICQG